MFPHYLLTLYRALTRHRMYAALNLLGLAAGIMVFLLAFLIVRYETGYDAWLPNVANTWRVDETWTVPGQAPDADAGAPFMAAPFLRQDFPQIAALTRVWSPSEPVQVGDTIDSERVDYVDPQFLDVLRLPLEAGDARTALADPGHVVISQSIARKYFGTSAALGRTLDITHGGARRSYVVAGLIADLPADTSLQFDILVPLAPALQSSEDRAFTNWGSSAGSIFLRLRDPADAAAIRAGLRAFIIRHASGDGDSQIGADPDKTLQLSLTCVRDAHLHDYAIGAPIAGVDPRVIASLGAVGLMALLIAIINYVNLATARAALRAREVAMRKVVGATREVLLRQFLGEALAMAALAGLIGLAGTELALPFINAMGGWALRLHYATIVPLLLVLVVAVGLAAGLYPAVLLAGYRPAAVLASARTPAGGRMGTRLRQALVMLQFVSAIGFAICTLVIDAQAGLLRTADRGFDRDGLIIVRSLANADLRPRQLALLNAMRRTPGVVAATMSDREPNTNSSSNTSLTVPGLTGPRPVLTYQMVGPDYARSYRTAMVAGRWFDSRYGGDDGRGRDNDSPLPRNIVINRAAVPVLGYANPDAALGQHVGFSQLKGAVPFTIVGVAADVRFGSPRDPVAPQMYLMRTDAFRDAQAAIRYAGVPADAMMQRLRDAWRTVAPDYPFVAQTADERLAKFYRPDGQRARLFSAGAVMAVAIACIGLYGLASFSTGRRMQEIGIRKVLGASTRDVLVLLVGQFVRPVLIANLFAWPIAYVAMRGWLAGFDQRVALSPLYFLLASLVALLIAVATVIGQAWRVARAEPARALRYE